MMTEQFVTKSLKERVQIMFVSKAAPHSSAVESSTLTSQQTTVVTSGLSSALPVLNVQVLGHCKAMHNPKL